MSLTAHKRPAEIVDSGHIERFLGSASFHRAFVVIALIVASVLTGSTMHAVLLSTVDGTFAWIGAPIDTPLGMVRAAELGLLAALLLVSAGLAVHVSAQRNVYPLSRVFGTLCATLAIIAAMWITSAVCEWSETVATIIDSRFREPFHQLDRPWRWLIAVAVLVPVAALFSAVIAYSTIKFLIYYPSEVPAYTRQLNPQSLRAAFLPTEEERQLFWRLHAPYAITLCVGVGLILFAYWNLRAITEDPWFLQLEITGLLMATYPLHMFATKQPHAEGSDRRPIQWIVYGQITCLLAFFACMSTFLAIQHRDPTTLGTAEEQLMLLNTLLMALYGGFALVFLLTLAVSILYKGTLDPALLIRRTWWVALGGLLFTFILFVAEQAATSWVSEQLNLGTASAVFLAASIQVACLLPLRKRGLSIAVRLINQLTPGAESDERNQLPVTVVLVGLRQNIAQSDSMAPAMGVEMDRLQNIAKRLAAEHDGRFNRLSVRTVMLLFRKSEVALAGAAELIRSWASGPDPQSATGALHAAAHVGPVLESPDGSFFGTTIDRTLRILGAAGPNELIVTAPVAAAAAGQHALEPLGFDTASASNGATRYYRLRPSSPEATCRSARNSAFA